MISRTTKLVGFSKFSHFVNILWDIWVFKTRAFNNAFLFVVRISRLIPNFKTYSTACSAFLLSQFHRSITYIK